MIYLDNAATTKTLPECMEIIKKYSEELYFNSSSPYAVQIAKELDNARQLILNKLGGVQGDKIIFTSGASESNNLAILGSMIDKKKTYIFSAGEHSSVNSVAYHLKNSGINVKFIPLKTDGTINLDILKNSLSDDVALVSVIFVSNETGAVNDISAIKTLMKTYAKNAKLHVDAVQGFTKLPFNVSSLGVDLCTICGHKIHAPKGVGALYVSKNTNIKAISFGGEQEFNLRPGTHNLPAIMSFCEAINYMFLHQSANLTKMRALKEMFINKISKLSDKFTINGNGSPYILSLSVKGIMGETLVSLLAQNGVYAATGSACNTKHAENRVLSQMGKSKAEVLGSVRISFSVFNTEEKINKAAQIFVSCVEKLLNLK